MARKTAKRAGTGPRKAASPSAGVSTPPDPGTAVSGQIPEVPNLAAVKADARRARIGVRIDPDGTAYPDRTVPYGVVSDGRV